MGRRFSPAMLIVAGFAILAIAMTWPLSRPYPLMVPHSDDAYFSVWRIAWVAHQLPRDPSTLFDTNVFYPEKGTLAFSDAMLLVSVLGSPFVWLGVNPVLVHNGLLIVAIFTSSIGAFFLARQVGASLVGGLLAGVIFGFAPYRFGHIGHLELQWVVWMPLAMMALRRLAANPSGLNGVLLGLCVTAQAFCSIYYGVFLCVYLAVAAAIELFRSTERLRVVKALSLGLIPLLMLALVYGPPYSKTRAQQGGRQSEEQQRYSARPHDFLRVSDINTLRGGDTAGVAQDELSLYPGAVSMVLAAAALTPPVGTTAVMYGVLGLTAFEGALGMNGFLFPALQGVIPALSSLRSPARFTALLLLSLSMMAAIGLTRINAAWPRWSRVVTAAAFAICLIEYWSVPVNLRPVAPPSDALRFLAQQTPGSVVLELPVPTLNSLWLYETTYELQSIHHWQPLVNGYSGYAPEAYRKTLEVLKTFPSDESVAHLQKIGVAFILINRDYYKEEDFAALMEKVSGRPEFWPPRAFGTQTVVVELKRQTNSAK